MNAFVGDFSTPDEVGVLVLDRESLYPLRFLEGWLHTVGITFAGKKGDMGFLVAAGARGNEVSRAVVYDLEDLTVRDSFPGGTTFIGDHDVRSARDGRHFYFVTADSLFKIDAREGKIVNKRRRVRPIVPGDVAVTTDPERIFLTDSGGGDFPGTGDIQVYDGELNDLGTVSLRSDKVEGGFPGGTPAMAGIAVNEEGNRLYVASGVRSFNFSQTAAVFVVDVENLSHVATQAIGDFRTEAIHAF